MAQKITAARGVRCPVLSWVSTKLMRGKGKTPPGRVNPTVKRFDLACVAQTKKDIAKDKKLSYRADQSPGGFGCGNSLLDFFRSQREQSKRWPLDRWWNRGCRGNHRGVVARVPPPIAEDAFVTRDVNVEVIDLDGSSRLSYGIH
jgi:hypothetical protein